MTHDAETLNATVRYTMWTVFALEEVLPEDDDERAELIAAAQAAVADDGLVIRLVRRRGAPGRRGPHGLVARRDDRGGAGAYQRLRASDLGRHLLPVWSVVGLHRPAEFNRSHVPAFLAGEPAGDYMTVYPFVRSYDWYVLPEDDRRRMLVEHGQAARGYADVRANTVSAFALGDYEWILAFEAPELHRIVDLMRDLRATDARLHVREEVPFYTGPRVSLETWADRQPRG